MSQSVELETLFKAKEFHPNDNQKKAINHTEGPLFLTAGPGSGKTRVLLWRALNLIVFHNVKPNEIFLATFTEKAALQLKQGLQGLLSIASQYTKQSYDIAEMYIGTLHSLCNKLLSDRRFNKSRARTRRTAILDEFDQYQFLYDKNVLTSIIDSSGIRYKDQITDAYFQINQWFGSGSYSRNEAVSNLILFFNRMNEEDFEDEKLVSNDEITNYLLKMTVKYREILGQERADFSSIQRKAYDYISRSSDAGSIFKYVIIDEYQDTNTIQQKIYMKLAEGTKNICVVGDDDQALYRFRGATVENLVGFETICQDMIGVKPTRIDLNTNYRSRKKIVETYTGFMDTCNWRDSKKTSVWYRIQNKEIQANSQDEDPSVIVQEGQKDEAIGRIADLIVELKQKGKISDYNQCAILFPSLRYKKKMNPTVEAFANALTTRGVPFYAPRAKNFLDTNECLLTFGLIAKILSYSTKISDNEYSLWFRNAIEEADKACQNDELLARFIAVRKKQIEKARKNYIILKKFCEDKKIDLNSTISLKTLPSLASLKSLDPEVRKALENGRLKNFIVFRGRGGKPVSVKYVLNRVTALDWTLLDLFYQLNCFKCYSQLYDKAEHGDEDAEMYNLGMITDYLSRFMETGSPILSGASFMNAAVANRFFDSFLYMVYRRGEVEFENAEDPFPKGCVPFITIHQSKGLEFPVVVLGSLSHTAHDARPLDVLVRDIQKANNELPKVCEPLEKMDEYDTMRMFYVALSRAKNLLILSKPKKARVFEGFKRYLDTISFPDADSFDVNSLPSVKTDSDKLARVYTYTADFLPYEQCPRNYMVFHKYGFVPSRSQTMFFGSLVHQTVEDILNYLGALEGH